MSYEVHPQQKWLLYLNHKALPPNRVLEVCYAVDQKRIQFPQVYFFPINHRVILPNEIVLEPDHPTFEENRVAGRIIVTILERLDIPYTLGYSGNKSPHIQVFIDPTINLGSEEKLRSRLNKGMDYIDLRNKVVDYLFDFISEQEENVLGVSRLDYANLYKNKLIREYGGINEKTGFRKTLLENLSCKSPPKISNSEDVLYPGVIKLWKPEEDLKKAVRYWRPRQKKKVYGQVFSK